MSRYWDDAKEFPKFMPIIRDVILAGFVLIASGMWGCPTYKVWQQGLEGQAELRRAEQNRKIKVEEAKAKLEAASLLNRAEVERAKGVAAANQIVADGLGGPEGYLRYLWIQGLQTNQMQVLYIPTEAGLPILEAGRLRNTDAK